MEMKLRGTGTIATLYVLRRTCCSTGHEVFDSAMQGDC
jgi:hypothetical protein